MKWLPEELEDVFCDYCKSHEYSDTFKRTDGMRVVECAVCGLAYLNPRPLPTLIPKLYGKDYFTGVTADRGDGGLKINLEAPLPHVNKLPPRPITLVNDNHGGFTGKSVLEIGCATGDLLLWAKNEGANIKGVEISDVAAEVARKRGLDVSTGTIEDFVRTNNEKYDIVFAFEVIEHVTSPTSFLKRISSVLKFDGLLILSTPNYRCAFSLREKWYGFCTSYEHLYFLSIDVLKRLGNNNKLHLEYWESNMKKTSENPIGQSWIDKKIIWVCKLLCLVRDFGFIRIISDKKLRKTQYQPFGDNHVLIVAYKKST